MQHIGPGGFALAGLPAGASIAPTGVYGKAEITWSPSAADIGTHAASVTVSDSGNGVAAPESASRGFKIVVRNANGAPLLLQSRAHDSTGYVQPTKDQLRSVRGLNSIYHNNGIQTWAVNSDGVAENVEIS